MNSAFQQRDIIWRKAITQRITAISLEVKKGIASPTHCDSCHKHIITLRYEGRTIHGKLTTVRISPDYIAACK